MEKFATSRHEQPRSKPVYSALESPKEKQILSAFTPEQQAEIRKKQQILSSLAYFIGKDFRIPVELNDPGAGWHWDFEKNIIRIDPKDLLEKPMDHLRFVICHEGGHRRISRTEFIPLEEWKQPGFSFMMNAIEDPRDNNFVAESYPKFKEQMALAYRQNLDFEAKATEQADKKLGHRPRFMQAGFEYIKQWFREAEGKEAERSKDLPEEVETVVRATLESARDSWVRYPSRKEADSSEELIKKYAELSYEINRDEIWPEFKKLVEKDLEDQKTQELFKEMQKGEASEKDGQSLPQELKDKLTPEEQQQLEEAIEKATPINLDSLSEELKQKIKDFMDALPERKKKELAEKAREAFKEFEKGLVEEMEGKLSDDPEKKAEREEKAASEEIEETPKAEPKKGEPVVDREELKKYRERIAKDLKKDANVYERMRREVLPIIDKLEIELREIFVARKAKGWEGGFKTGKRIDLKKRIQEKAKSVPVIESKAWQKRELPQEKDYAISLLVDLSGSMANDNKIQETFKAVIVLSEVLNRLSINVEILGFNDRIYEYQNFGQPMSKPIRENMGGMLHEVNDTSGTGKARWNDDGWALEKASERLAHQRADQKFLIVLSDGRPEESSMHPRSKYELGNMIGKVLEETDVRLVGMGIGGSGVEAVKDFYPRNITCSNVEQMAKKLADLIKDIIDDYDKY